MGPIFEINYLGRFLQRKRGWHNLIYESFVQSTVMCKLEICESYRFLKYDKPSWGGDVVNL